MKELDCESVSELVERATDAAGSLSALARLSGISRSKLLYLRRATELSKADRFVLERIAHKGT